MKRRNFLGLALGAAAAGVVQTPAHANAPELDPLLRAAGLRSVSVEAVKAYSIGARSLSRSVKINMVVTDSAPSAEYIRNVLIPALNDAAAGGARINVE